MNKHEIYRKGKSSAILFSAAPKNSAKKYWKKARPLIDLGSDIASRMLREERKKNH